MTLLHDSPDPGFLRRLCRVYREKRRLVPIKEYVTYRSVFGGEERISLQNGYRRMPRWAAFQIARHQASQARHRA